MGLADYFCYGVFWLVIIAFAVWWIRMRLGFDKRWFIMPAAPLISRNFYFFLPTFILGFAVLLIVMLLFSFNPGADLITLLIIVWALWGLGFVPAYFEPDWLAPNWYRWLKREHGDIMPYLAMDAHEMGRQAWMQRGETQEGLEEWAEEVRRKYTL